MNLVVSQDPRTNLVNDRDLETVVSLSGQQLTLSVNASVNASYTQTTINSASWTINPPSNQTIISRELFVKYYCLISSDVELQPLLDCARQYPMSSCIESTQVKINGSASISKQVGDLVHAEACFFNESEDRRHAFQCPAYPDQFGELSAGRNTIKNPAGTYGDLPTENSRGSWILEPYVPAIPGQFTYRLVVSEPLWISPFSDAVGEESEGLVNVNELYVSIRFVSQLDRFMTCMERLVGPQVGSIRVGWSQAPELVLTYITPSMLAQIPASITYPYANSVLNRKLTGQALASGQSASFQSDYYRLGMIPKYLMVYFPRTSNQYDFTKPNSFLSIESVRVNWNNQNSLLSDANQEQLYQISRRNGLNQTFLEWKQYKGGPLMLEFGRDLLLSDGLSPGTVGSYSLSITVQVKNSSLESGVVCDMVVAWYNAGGLVVGQNTARSYEGLLTPAMVLSAEKSEVMESNPAKLAGQGLLSRMNGMVPSKKKKHSTVAPVPMSDEPMEPRRIGGSLRRK